MLRTGTLGLALLALGVTSAVAWGPGDRGSGGTGSRVDIEAQIHTVRANLGYKF